MVSLKSTFNYFSQMRNDYIISLALIFQQNNHKNLS
jgi:hypothetical protein